MGFVLDLIVVAIIAVCVFVSARRGFVRVAIEFVGLILVTTLAFNLSTPLSETTYDKFIEPKIIETVSVESSEDSQALVESTWDSLPDFIKENPAFAEFDSEEIAENISADMQGGAEDKKLLNL